MTSADYAIVIPLYGAAAGLAIDRIFAGFRRLKQAEAERQFRKAVDARGVHQDEKLHEIKQQTNGNTEKMLASISTLQTENVRQMVEIGRLQGMVAGLQARTSGRATDAVVVPSVPAPPAPPPPLPTDDTARGTP